MVGPDEGACCTDGILFCHAVTQRLARDARHAKKVEQAQAVATNPLTARVYNVLSADPPWAYRNTGVNGAAATHYPTIPLEEFAPLPHRIGLQAAADAVLFLPQYSRLT